MKLRKSVEKLGAVGEACKEVFLVDSLSVYGRERLSTAPRASSELESTADGKVALTNEEGGGSDCGDYGLSTKYRTHPMTYEY